MVFGYDPETEALSSQWKDQGFRRPKKVRQCHTKIKKMLIIFCDSLGIIHYEFTPPSHTVNQEFYKRVLKHLREKVRG
jgi:hypothetical protein